MKRLIVYVDGFNLYHGLHQKSGRKHLWLDLVALGERLRPRSQLTQVKYFTAPVLDDSSAASRQGIYQRAMLAKDPARLRIIQGRYQRKTQTCRKCKTTHVTYEEKETDVNIATSLVTDALLGRFDDALIISADSDMVPAIKAVKTHAAGVFMAAAFPPERYSAELASLLPSSFHIGMSHIRQSQLPDDLLETKSGIILSRPGKWATA